MTLTRWGILASLVIFYAAYWYWETKRENLKKKIASEADSNEEIHSFAPTIDEETRSSQVYENSENLLQDENRTHEINLEDLLYAQNRTTHAVRAFVRFLFIQLSGITLASLFWLMSDLTIDEEKCLASQENCSGNTFLQALAVVILIIGVFWSSQAGWSELEKSEIPSIYKNKVESNDQSTPSSLLVCVCGERNPRHFKRCHSCGEQLNKASEFN